MAGTRQFGTGHRVYFCDPSQRREGPQCFEERERSGRIELPDMPNRCELLLVLAKEVVGLRRKEPVLPLPSSHEPTLQIELLQTPQRFTRTQGLQRR